MAIGEAKFRQAAWTYVVYGLAYLVGGLYLTAAGFGPRGTERYGLAWSVIFWFVVGILFVVVFPWLLVRQRRWFERWVLSRRDFARLLAALVAARAIGVATVAWSPRVPTVPVLGTAVPVRVGAWAFACLTVVTAVMLARAAWSREP